MKKILFQQSPINIKREKFWDKLCQINTDQVCLQGQRAYLYLNSKKKLNKKVFMSVTVV